MQYNNNIYYSNNGIPTLIPLQSVIESLQSTVSNLQNNSYTSNNKPYVVGYYQGNGASSRAITLGFTPVCVIVMYCGSATYSFYADAIYGGLAVTNSNASIIDGDIGMFIVSNGFMCYHNFDKKIVVNNNGFSYNYIAFK